MMNHSRRRGRGRGGGRGQSFQQRNRNAQPQAPLLIPAPVNSFGRRLHKYLSLHFSNPDQAVAVYENGADPKQFKSIGFVNRSNEDRNKHRLEILDDLLNQEALEPKSYLDVGTGDGSLTIAILAHYQFDTTAISNSPDEPVEIKDADVSDIGDVREYKGLLRFDLITCFMTCHHIKPFKEQVTFVRAMRKLLTSRGILLIKEHDIDRTDKEQMCAYRLEHKVWEARGFPCCKAGMPRTLSNWKTLFPTLFVREETNFGRHIYFAIGAHPLKPQRFLSLPQVPVHTEKLVEELKSEGVDARVVEGFNAHDEFAADRTITIRSVLRRIYQRSEDPIIHIACLSDWGRVGNELKNWDGRFVPHYYQTYQTPADLMRFGKGEVKPKVDDLSSCKFGIINDQYDGMTPGEVHGYFNLMAPGAFIFVIMAPIFGEGGVVNGQAYYKDVENDVIICKPDDVNTYTHRISSFPYWIIEGGAAYAHDGEVSLMYSQIVSSSKRGKRVFQLVANDDKFDIPHVKFHTDSCGSIKTITMKKIQYKWSWLSMSDEHVPVEYPCQIHSPVYNLLCLRKIGEGISTWTSSATRSLVDQQLKADDDWVIFQKSFPNRARCISENTVNALLFHEREEKIRRFTELNDYAIPHSDRLKSSLKGLGRERYVPMFDRLKSGFFGYNILPGGERVKSSNRPWWHWLALGAVGYATYRLGGWRAFIKPVFGICTSILGNALIPQAVAALGPLLANASLIRGQSLNPVCMLGETLLKGHPWVSIGLHLITRRDLSIPQRIYGGFVASQLGFAGHMMHNVMVSCYNELRKPTTLKWERFKDLYNGQEYYSACDVTGSSAVPIGERLLSTNAHPTYHLTKIHDPEHILKIKASGCLVDDLPDDTRVEVITPILITNAVMYAATPKSPKAYLGALRMRQLVKVQQTVVPEEWTDVAERLCAEWSQYIEPPGVDFDDLTEWAEAYQDGRKRRQALQLIQDVDDLKVPPEWCGLELGVPHDLIPYSLSQFAKPDELLLYKEDAEGLGGIKPRTITCLPLILQFHIQPWMRRASKKFKEVLAKPFFLRGRWYWFTYAAGMNATDLTNWLHVATDWVDQNGGVAGILMGDDSLLYDGYLKKFVETDFSHYDQSQCGHLITIDEQMLVGLGVPLSVAQTLTIIAARRSKSRGRTAGRSWEIVFKPARPGRVSGAPNTSLSNTINNMIAMILAGEQGYTPERFAELGLEAVISFHDDVGKATFLKGAWFLNKSGGRDWITLQGRLLKAGKLTSPLETQSDINIMAYGLAMGLGEINESFPLLGPFRKKLLELSGHEFDDKETMFEMLVRLKSKLNRQGKYHFGHDEHRISNVLSDVDRSKALEFVEERYGLSQLDVEELEQAIRAVPSLPWFLGDPRWLRLRNDF
jgi:hypothetical protein